MIVVLPYQESDWQRAERLLDAIFWISERKPIGHCLLISDSKVHKEYQLKVKLSAEVAFPTVDSIEVGVAHDASKISAINTVFRHAAHHVYNHYKEPWLWLEADNVPLTATWLKDLFRAYDKQPRRYMGRFMKASSGRFLSRTAIYPPNAVHDLDGPCKGEPPFERVASILSRCTNTSLINVQKWTPELGIPEGSALLNGDRSGELIEKLIQDAPEPKIAKRRKVTA